MPNIISGIKNKRLEWFGHVWRVVWPSKGMNSKV